MWKGKRAHLRGELGFPRGRIPSGFELFPQPIAHDLTVQQLALQRADGDREPLQLRRQLLPTTEALAAATAARVGGSSDDKVGGGGGVPRLMRTRR